MDSGYVKIHRKIWNSSEWMKKPFDVARAWIDLILLANSQRAKILCNKKELILEPGQHLTSEKKLANRWGWSRDKVKAQLKKWQSSKNIIIEKPDSRSTILTLVNYENHQYFSAQNRHKIGTKSAYLSSKNNSDYNESSTQNQHKIIHKTGTNNIIYNIYESIPEEKELKRPMSDWQVDISCVNRRLQKIDKLGAGDPKLCAMLIKQHGLLLVLAVLEQIIANEVVFNDKKHAKSYVIATLKKKSIGDTQLKKGDKKFYQAGQNINYKNVLPNIEDLLAGR